MSSRTDLVRALSTLRGERRTGVLKVTESGSAREETFVYLAGGIAVFAEAGSHGETLGRLLVRQGALTQAQYVEILGKMTDALVLNEQVRFGEVAVELGHMSEEAVRKALGDQVRAKVVRVLLHPAPTWTFEDSESRLDDVVRFPVSLEAAVLDAARWLDDDAKAESGLGKALASILVPTMPLADLTTRFVLSPAEAHFAAELDGTKTGTALLSTPASREVDGPALLLAFAMMRSVRESSPSAAARLVVPTPITAMRPHALARPSTPLEPIITLTRPPTPVDPLAPFTRPPGAVSAAPAAMSTRPPVTTTTAPRPLTAPPSRTSTIMKALAESKARHDPRKTPESSHEAKLMAETAFQAGLAHFRQSRWAQAVPDLLRASQLMPASEEYRLCAKWAQISARSEEPPHPLERAELGKLALSAIKTDPKFAFGYYVAGNMALLADEAAQAEKLLARAVKLDASLLDAQRLLRLVQRRRTEGGAEGGGGSFLGKKLW